MIKKKQSWQQAINGDLCDLTQISTFDLPAVIALNIMYLLFAGRKLIKVMTILHEDYYEL